METFAEAVHRTIADATRWRASLADAALLLPDALGRCDDLAFDEEAEVLAYATLHLVDRYGRILQVLEHVVGIGRLPLKRVGVTALEVGAGPAPALYATRDFYSDLLHWPGRGDMSSGTLAISHPLDRGSGWDRFLHWLSEQLIDIRDTTLGHGQLAFARSFGDFATFDVREVHNAAMAAAASQIEWEFERADEPISLAAAFRFAYKDGVTTPSAYDLIFVPYFLTQPDMLQAHEAALRPLTRSLTPGGLLVLLSATGNQYARIRSTIEALAKSAGLLSVGPAEALQANSDDMRRDVVAGQVRRTVAAMKEACPAELWERVSPRLPRDVQDNSVPYDLPKFSALIFANQHPPRRRRFKRSRH